MWNSKPEYAPEFPASRFVLNHDKKSNNLTILKTTEEDEGMYHCALTEWLNSEWSGTYLLVKEKTSNYTVVQPPASDPVGAPMTLQCSVLSETKTCPGDHSVFWFRAGTKQSHPNIIYTDGRTSNECEKKSDTQRKCVFSKNVSSSDAGTYYCAVATCGQIFIGNGATVEIVQTTHAVFIAVGVLTFCLVISVVGNIVFICSRRVCEKCKGE
ncbi:uncharacterized protein LOC131981454 [Centropristis striata]|uniref:uncharacterized protein LOC131981454 n=1 Tax=Centropristis striata TaxID=184440 RepID=UPI0027E0855D|nr:uncharacterized protein LOC131981454 [Centropristis striata]